jgi:hypothetical protein
MGRFPVFDSFRSSISIAALSLATVEFSLFLTPACRAQQTHDSYTVTGVVKNSATGQPVARALVDGQSDAALTDSQGRFELHLTQRFTQLQVRRPGYTGGERGGFRSLSLDAETTNLTLYLTPTATITGHITVESGADPPNVTFMAFKRRQVRGHERWLMASNAVTNSDGIFRMYEIEAPATYVLCGRPHPEPVGSPEPNKPLFGYPLQCFPAGSAEGSDVLNLSAGQQADLDILLAKQRFYPVTIATTNNPQGPGGVGIQIRYSNGLDASQGVRWNEQTHTWEVELPNGSYYAEGRSQCGKTICYGRVDFKVANTSLQGLRLVVVPLAPVAVAVHKDFTDNVAERDTVRRIANGRSTPLNVGLNLELLPADDITNGWGARPIRHPAGSDSDLLALEGVTPGRYWVQASYFHNGYVSAITSGGVDLMKEPLVVGAGNSTAPIEITLRNDGGQIDCVVVDRSGGPSGAQVYAIPMGPHISRILQIGGSMGGRVSISNLAPGTYSVIALDGFSDLNSMDTRELDRLAEKGKTVTVTAGGNVNVQIGVTHTSAEEQNQ